MHKKHVSPSSVLNLLEVQSGSGLNSLVLSVFIFSCASLLFYFNADYFLNGDVVYYANFIHNRQFDTLTLHNGYYLTGLIADFLLGHFSSIALENVLVLMNVLFGALGLVAAFWLANEFLKSYYLSLLCILVLAFSGRYYINATSAEIYMQQTFLMLLSYYLFLKMRFLLAGLIASAALFTTPLSIVGFLFFPVFFHSRKMERSALSVFALPIVLSYGSFLILCHEELLWGLRGILTISSQEEFQPLIAIKQLFWYQAKHYTVLLFLALAGCFLLPSFKPILYASLAVSIPHFYLIAKLTGEDHVFILPTDFFFSLLIVLGCVFLTQITKSRGISGILLATHVGISIYTQPMFDSTNNRHYGDEMVMIYEHYLKQRNACLITDWSHRMALSYFNKSKGKGILESGDAYFKSYDEAHLRSSSREFFKNYSEVYVLEAYKESGAAKLFLSQSYLGDRFTKSALHLKVERNLGYTCELIFSGIRDLYRCNPPSKSG